MKEKGAKRSKGQQKPQGGGERGGGVGGGGGRGGWEAHLLEGFREALVLLGNLKHQLLVLAVLLLHLRHVLLEGLDQVQIVVRDIVVIVLDV